MPLPSADPMTPGEVARIFGVGVEAVRAWADKGDLPSFRTPAGHRRFWRRDVEAYLERTTSPEPDPEAVAG